MLPQIKTVEELNQEALRRLEEAGINHTPGSIARLFIHLINDMLGDFYETLSVYHANAFLSTAEGIFLDSIGAMLNCQRYPGEMDENYRYRINQQLLSLATANENAIRLACLSVDGVEDVQLRAHYLGTGSFVVVVNNQTISVTNEILTKLKEVVSKVAGYGIRYDVIAPIEKPISLEIKLLFKEVVTDSVAQDLRLEVMKSVREYISNRQIGEAFVINELTQLILNASPLIANYIYQSFQVNGETVFWANQTCEWNEKFTVGSTTDAIKVL